MEILREKLETIAIKYLGKSSLHGLNQGPIQDKKLKNAKLTHGITDETIFLLHDATLFGSAKDGMVFTDKAIYWREVRGTSQKIDYRELVESTAHNDLAGSDIKILGKNHRLEAKNDYYHIICELKSDLITVISLYESYYQNAIENLESLLVSFAENKAYKKVIEELNVYQGLFLNPEDKSEKIRLVSFEAYLAEKDFSKAREELAYIKVKSPMFYEEAARLLEGEIKEEQYTTLEQSRIYAIEKKDFKTAYSLLEEQKEIGIRTANEMEEISRAIKICEFETIGEDRLKAVENEEYDIALLLLEKQRGMALKSESDIGIIRESIEIAKRESLTKYHEQLKSSVDSEDFLASKEIINYIHKIEPSYDLEKEEILMLIYQYKLEEAGKRITNLLDSDLKSDLKEVLEITKKMLYEEIRSAARKKDDDFFAFFPDLWRYIDEYGMSAHHYFALEADIEGLLKALEGMNGDLNLPNIFGHNFIDLLGLACDSSLGDKKEGLLDVLEEIKSRVKLSEIENRINYLEKGSENQLKVQEYRLSELNKKLLSNNHFEKIRDEMESCDAYDIDYVSQHVAMDRVRSDECYPIRGEFETLAHYEERYHVFAQKALGEAGLPEEFKDEISKLIEVFKAKGSRYIPSLSTWIRVEEKQLKILKALETIDGRLGFYNLYFPIQIPTVEMGDYNAEREIFVMIVNGSIKEMAVPLAMAENFKKAFDGLEFSCNRMFEEGLFVDVCLYEFEGEQMVLPFMEREDFGR